MRQIESKPCKVTINLNGQRRCCSNPGIGEKDARLVIRRTADQAVQGHAELIHYRIRRHDAIDGRQNREPGIIRWTQDNVDFLAEESPTQRLAGNFIALDRDLANQIRDRRRESLNRKRTVVTAYTRHEFEFMESLQWHSQIERKRRLARHRDSVKAAAKNLSDRAL